MQLPPPHSYLSCYQTHTLVSCPQQQRKKGNAASSRPYLPSKSSLAAFSMDVWCPKVHSSHSLLFGNGGQVAFIPQSVLPIIHLLLPLLEAHGVIFLFIRSIARLNGKVRRGVFQLTMSSSIAMALYPFRLAISSKTWHHLVPCVV